MKRRNALVTLGAAAIATAVAVSPVIAEDHPRPATAIGYGFHARMVSQPGQGDALVSLLFEAPAFEHGDCKVFLVGRSKADPNVVFVTEGWVSEAAHAAFTATEEAQSYTARFGQLVVEWTTSDEIPVGGKADLE